MSKIVMIDNNVISFQLNKDNGFVIKSWYGDTEDYELLKYL